MDGSSRKRRTIGACCSVVGVALLVTGCQSFPLGTRVRADAKVDARARVDGALQVAADAAVHGSVEVKIPTTFDPGPMVGTVVRPAHDGGTPGGRVGLIDVDGLLLNQNATGLYSTGENPVGAFREKLEAAGREPSIRAIVVRINSPGGGVAATDLMSHELDRFRAEAGKPVVTCLMDVATAGAYHLALGGDAIVALPSGLTGAIGAIINHFNMRDAMSQLNLTADPIKAGERVDLGSVTEPLDDEGRRLLQEIADADRDRFRDRVRERRPRMTPDDHAALADGRIVSNTKALQLHMVDRLGYIHEAIAEAARLGGLGADPEVVAFNRRGVPTHSIYSITPNTPIQGDIVPFSYPGLDRSRTPTFLYLWQPDPTVFRAAGR